MILDEINVSYFKGIQELDIKFDKILKMLWYNWCVTNKKENRLQIWYNV